MSMHAHRIVAVAAVDGKGQGKDRTKIIFALRIALETVEVKVERLKWRLRG